MVRLGTIFIHGVRSMDRRTLLKLSAVGVGATLLAPGVATAAGALPPIPGMLGDRVANEMWFQFDDALLYHARQEVLDAYAVLSAHVGVPNFVDGFRDKWLELSVSPDYPGNYAAFAAPVRPQLKLLSELELTYFDRFYQPNSVAFVDAFGYFGQGVLFDPRRADIQQEVHTMVPVTNYHGWHAYVRAMMFLDINVDRWARIDPVIAFAWAVQSTAKPSAHVPNPGLPYRTVAKLAGSWLPRSPEQLDKDFHSMPYPAGIS